MIRVLLALGLLAGCAPASLVPEAPLPSASSRLAPDSHVSLGPLDPVPPPVPPVVLREPAVSMPMMISMASGHGAHGASAEPHTLAGAPASPLGDALTAYLVLHDALARDTIEGVSEAAQAFNTAFGLAIQTAPADDPHVWHQRATETAAVRTQALALASATDLASARKAFGELSAPFASLIDAVGVPEDFELVRHTCGMQPQAPEGGVWLQNEGPVRNPYFGGAMRMCSLEQAPAAPAHNEAGHVETPDHLHGS